MTQFACEALRVQSVAPPPLSMSALCAEASPAEPVLFITT
jgi:hypothetical protein